MAPVFHDLIHRNLALLLENELELYIFKMFFSIHKTVVSEGQNDELMSQILCQLSYSIMEYCTLIHIECYET